LQHRSGVECLFSGFSFNGFERWVNTMLVKQFVDEGLGNSSYLIASEQTGQAAVLDPQRDVDRYLQIAEGLGLRLAYTLDTHLHNDFISGSRELAARAGVQVGASRLAELGFAHLPLQDGDLLQLGDLSIRVLATPGHTPEHVSFTLTGAGKPAPAALFTGGALIVGGAARTDLLGDSQAEPLARRLYHVIHDKLLQFPDEVAVYPTHGAGSFCAAPAVAERASTIGQERRWNPLVLAQDEDDFVSRLLGDLPSYPAYFKHLRRINQRGPAVLGGLPLLRSLKPEDVLEQTARGVVIVDTRRPPEFMSGHIPGAYGIPLTTPLITWAGWVIPFGAPLILLAERTAEREEAVRQLIRIGLDDLRGYLEGGMPAWEAEGLPVSSVPILPAEQVYRQMKRGNAPLILDVRSDAEWRLGHLPKAIHVEAGRLPEADLPLAQDELKVVHCGHSERSTVGLSILERRGVRNLALLDGGYSGWRAAGYPEVRGNA
jgi:hydroxyacylglutathione hydrolase